jgi:hypothetical protein
MHENDHPEIEYSREPGSAELAPTPIRRLVELELKAKK